LKLLIIVFLVFSVFLSIASGELEPVWNSTCHVSGYTDWVTDIIETNDDGYLVSGIVNRIEEQGVFYDPFLLKIDRGGNIVWKRVFESGKWEEFFGIALTADNGFLVCGFSGGKAMMVRLDSDGSEIWRELYGPYRHSEFWDIVACQDGGYVVAGVSSRPSYLPSDFYVVKIDQEGNKVWEGLYDSVPEDSYTEWAYSIAQSNDGDYGIVGKRYDVDDIFVLRVDDEGDKIWSKTFGSNTSVLGEDIVATNDGGYIIVGNNYILPNDGEVVQDSKTSDVYILKIDADGNTVWEHTYGEAGNDYGMGIVHLNGEEHVIAGAIESVDSGGNGIWLLAIDNLGNKIWDMEIEGITAWSGFNNNMLAPTSDGGFVLAATVSRGQDADVYVTKLGGDPWVSIDLIHPAVVVAGQNMMVKASLSKRVGTIWGSVDYVQGVLLSSSGNHSDFLLFDDGTHGDETPGDDVYTSTLYIDPETFIIGKYIAKVNFADLDGRTAAQTSEFRVIRGQDEVIYDEGEEDWAIHPEPKTRVNIDESTSSATSGTKSMAVSISLYGYVDFLPPEDIAFNTFSYESIDVSINRGNCTSFIPRIIGQMGGGRASTKSYPKWVTPSPRMNGLT